jgi:hypothetical protein
MNMITSILSWALALPTPALVILLVLGTLVVVLAVTTLKRRY